jgi:D-alanine--poly(phosphoribitol) ligase subunit 1
MPKVIVNGFTGLGHAAILEERRSLLIDLQGETTRSKLAARDDESIASLSTMTGGHPAYIMFTSGSTGIPKGAVMSHNNVLNFIHWAQDRFEVTPEDIFSNVNPMYFDNSVFDFYVSLFSGASLVPLTATQVRDPCQLLDVINRLRCTIWFSVPSLLVYLLATRALDTHDLPAVRKIVFGGEGLPKSKLKKLYDLFGERAELENVYGPTECTCICSAHTIQPADFADMKALAPLGFLAPDFSYEILGPADSADEGELFLCGPNVGLGYYNDHERTATSFIQNPMHRRFRDIGYRTGDLVRRDPDGRLHFIGRTDFQIKHMGYRIELEEVESALASLPQVGECAVIYRKLGDGLGELVGFVVAAEPTDPDELVHGVAHLLPAYMIPRRISVLKDLPRNANGKIDRIALQGVAASTI